jgi:ABC-type transport system involved in multi-copper enzyme maturation permease subunit
MNPLRSILIVARLTLAEAVRRRLLWSLVVLTIALVAATGWLFDKAAEMTAIEAGLQQMVLSQLLIMAAFMFSFVLTMTAAFAAAPAIGPEIESGMLLAVLARPIRRSEVLLGRWLGLAFVVILYALAAGYLELAAVALLTGYLPVDPLAAPVWLALESLVLLTLALVIGTRITPVAAGSVAVVGFGLAWMVGIAGGIGDVLNVDALRAAGTAGRLMLPTDVFWRGAMYSLRPPDEVLAIAGPTAEVYTVSPFFAGSPPPFAWLAWCAIWLAGTLAVGALLLRRREL